MRKRERATPVGLEALAGERVWHLWVLETPKDGKPRKVPHALDGRRRGNNDLDGLGTWEEAIDARDRLTGKGVAPALFAKGVMVGIGLNTLALARLGFGAADLDQCVTAGGGVEPWAQRWVDMAVEAGAYIEVTPSGRGLRVIGRVPAIGVGSVRKAVWLPPESEKAEAEAAGAGDAVKRAAIEVFAGVVGFITVTGTLASHSGSCLGDIAGMIGTLVAEAGRQAADRRLRKAGAQRAAGGAPIVIPAELRGEEAEVRALAAVMANGDGVGWDEWNRVTAAFFNASGGEAWGQEAAATWSMKSEKHEDASLLERWRHFERGHHFDAVGIRTLRGVARDAATPDMEFDGMGVEDATPIVIAPVAAAAAAGGGKGAAVAGAAQPKPKPKGALGRLMLRWAWLGADNTYFDVEARDFMPEVGWLRANAVDFPLHMRGRNGLKERYHARADRLTLVGQVYAPGEAGVVHVDDGERIGLHANVWRPSALVPDITATEADIGPWLNHLRWLLEGREDAVRRVVGRMAWMIQNPTEKVNGILLIIGDQRIGKDMILIPLKALVGAGNTAHVTGAMLAQQYSPFLAKRLVVVSEIRHFGRGLGRDIEDDIKTWTAAPPDWLVVNPKMKGQFVTRNRSCWFAFSNHEDAMKVRAGDGRVEVYRTHVSPQPDAYYRALGAWLEAGGSEKVVGWMAELDLGEGSVWAFDGRGAVPMSQEKADLARATLGRAAAWVLEQVEEGGALFGRTVVTAGDLKGLLEARRMQPGLEEVRREMSPRAITTGLREGGAVCLYGNRFRDTDGKRQRVWVLKPEKAALLEQMPVDGLRRLLARDRGMTSRAEWAVDREVEGGEGEGEDGDSPMD